MGARELEKLAKQFESLGDEDIAQGISAWAQVARKRGRETFSLPEGVIRLPDLTIGGVKPKELEKALGNRITDYARDLLRSKDFITLPEQQVINPIIATPSVMGLTGTATTEQIFDRADKLNWDLCPAEVGPHLVLAFNNQTAYKDLPIKLPIWIAMKQITDRDGYPRVFDVGRDAGGSWLSANWAKSTHQWDPGDQLGFSPRK